MTFRNYRLPNTRLCKYLESHASVDPGTVNMLKDPKHCRNVHDSSFISFGHDSRKILVGKSLC